MKLLYTLPIAFQLAQAADHLNTDGDEEFAMRLAMQEFEDAQGVASQPEPADPDLDAAIAMSLAEDMYGQPSSSSSHPESTESDEAIARLLEGIESLGTAPAYHAQPNNDNVLTPDDSAKFREITDRLRAIYQNGDDVHKGDSYIPGQIPAILAMAEKILRLSDASIISYSNKALLDLKLDLKALISLYASDFSDYKYEGSAKSVADILQIIENQFNRSAREIENYASGNGTKVWAIAFALAMNMLNDFDVRDEIKLTIVKHLIDQSIEGMITQGGCIQGFVNRGFIALLNMLAYYLPR